MDARAAAIQARNAINSYKMATYQVEGTTLSVTVPGGLVAEQRELIKAHKSELVALLTTPPEQSGMCVRGHTIVWRCNDYGLWVCACYFETPEAVAEPPEQEIEPASATRNYWKAKEGSTPMLPSPFTQKAGLKVQSDNHREYSIQEKALW